LHIYKNQLTVTVFPNLEKNQIFKDLSVGPIFEITSIRKWRNENFSKNRHREFLQFLSLDE
jgi:hypothetical protein